jgi:RND family efflux transporter MFP subunit
MNPNGRPSRRSGRVAIAASTVALLVFVPVLAVAVLAGLPALAPQDAGAPNGNSTAAPAAPNKSSAVGTVVLDDVAETYAADALIEAVRSATVSAQISGQVIDLRVDAGDRVSRGQLLARIDTRTTDSHVAASRAAIALADAQLTQARINYERTQQLIAQNFVSRSALDKAEADYKAAQAAVGAAQAGGAESATARSFAEIRSPIDGLVTRRLVERGEFAAPGRALFDVHDPAALRAVGSLPQFVLARAANATRADVEIPALAQMLTATRVAVLPSADPRLLSREIRADLPATGAALVPGMAAKIHVPTGTARKLTMPANAVVRRGELTATYVIDAAGKPLLRQIRVGNAVADGRIEVLSGLADGERVLVQSQAMVEVAPQAAR